jgi:arylsulfatase
MHTRSYVVGLLALLGWAAVVAAGERPPNVVLIYADDLGYGDLGCYGATDIKTPHLDRLAKEGTRFTSFYVAQAVCTASRAALLTGCYANRVGMAGALNHTSPTGLNPRETLLSKLCKSRGYATAIYGKWHLGHQPPFLPTRQGFDEFAGIPYSNDNGPLHPVTRGIPPLPYYENEEIVELDPDQSQFTSRFTERAIRFIERNKERPFFLYLPHVMPHVPIFASKAFQGTSQRGLYGDVVQELDAGIGAVLEALARYGLTEQTMVIFISDNGPFLSYGEHAGSAGRLREGKLTAFEGGVRVPGIIRWPGRVPAGRVSDELVTTLDLYTTLAHLVGAELPKTKIDGVNLTPLLLGEAGAKGRETFWYYSGDELHAVRRGDWKLHFHHDYLTVAGEPGRGGKPSNFGQLKPESIELSGVRGIASRHGYRVEQLGQSLFNLKDDPGETTNVAGQHPEIVKQLEALAKEARADLGDEITRTRGTNIRPAGDVRPPLPAQVGRIMNQEYARPNGRSLLLDLYVPSAPKDVARPCVVWVHGGGWAKGSKLTGPPVWLAEHGYVVASIDYRLTHEARWPAQIEDCRAAIRWLRILAEHLHIDPDRIAVAGGSAGGHLAALLGTADRPADEKVSSQVGKVIDFYGPADLLTMPANTLTPGKTEADLARSHGAKLLGGIVRDRPDLARQASALAQVSKGDAAFLIIHGDRDPQVPLDQSERLHAALQAAGVPSELMVVPGAGHGGPAFDTPAVRERMLMFLRRSVSP